MRYKLWWCSCLWLKIEGQYSSCLQEGRKGREKTRENRSCLLKERSFCCYWEFCYLFVHSSIDWLCLLATLGFLTLLCHESSAKLNVDQKRVLTKRRVWSFEKPLLSSTADANIREENRDFIVSFEPFARGLGQSKEVVNHVPQSRQHSLKAYVITSVAMLLSKDKRKLFSPLCQMGSRHNPGALWVFLASLAETVLIARLGLRVGNHSRRDNFITFRWNKFAGFCYKAAITLSQHWIPRETGPVLTLFPPMCPFSEPSLITSFHFVAVAWNSSPALGEQAEYQRTRQTKCLWGFFTFLTKDEGYSWLRPQEDFITLSPATSRVMKFAWAFGGGGQSEFWSLSHFLKALLFGAFKV